MLKKLTPVTSVEFSCACTKPKDKIIAKKAAKIKAR